MGMSVGGGGDEEPMMDMNTTPLIDVMLVLLVMFIITIPIQTHAVKIDLPPKSDAPPPTVKPIKNDLIVTQDDRITWNNQPVDLTTLKGLLVDTLKITGPDGLPKEPELHFAPMAQARYELVDRVMATIKFAHLDTPGQPTRYITKMGFVGNELYSDY
jgi:biopolymer transport protein ExbD